VCFTFFNTANSYANSCIRLEDRRLDVPAIFLIYLQKDCSISGVNVIDFPKLIAGLPLFSRLRIVASLMFNERATFLMDSPWATLWRASSNILVEHSRRLDPVLRRQREFSTAYQKNPMTNKK
jgi:hypothetical protein